MLDTSACFKIKLWVQPAWCKVEAEADPNMLVKYSFI